jgi:four helix bundle protein
MLDHEKLDAYQRALDFTALASEILAAIPRGHGHLNDQLARASTSITLNIAEGAGKFTAPDKRRHYMMARGSATECAALLDVLLKLSLVDVERHQNGKQMLLRVVSMLVKLCRSLE